ncbi:MAG: CHASE2 domain-containing protein [Gammaproteobacteria bacterium]|nr:CHASE2 domain-containing protein [Gammaproteobacteria bacterium]
MKKKVWQKDWFAGLAISLFFFGAIYLFHSDLLQTMERMGYDFGVNVAARDPGDQVAVVAIDDQSIKKFGRWPWSREIIAQMVDQLLAGGAKVVGLTILYSEPQLDPGLKLLRELQSEYARSSATDPAFAERLAQAESALDADSRLAHSLEQAGNVVLAMEFVPGDPIGNPDAPLPDYIARFALENVDDPSGDGIPPLQTLAAVPPIAQLGTPARGIGHLLNLLDVDGGVRAEALVLAYYDKLFASQSLLIAASSLNLGVGDIKVHLGDSIELGRLRIKTDPALRMQTFFYRGVNDRPAFEVDSFYDVALGNIPAENYRGKIVLIGPTAFGLGSSLVTPVDENTAPVLIMAHNVASILNEDFFISPGWAGWVEFLVLALVAGYLIALLPRLKAGIAFAMSGGLIAVLVVTELMLMKTQAMWLQLFSAATLLAVGHLLITTMRFLVTEAGKLRSDTESAESNKNLGLAMQQQGQLDMAFERFRRVPLDDGMMDTLMVLASDYEKKRQFNKANAVYQYMATYNPKFRDLEARMTRAKAAEETIIFGGARASTAGGTMILEGGGVEKPMLGRYQVEKELGKGAMGIVYLGRDPKINRVVAIKTMALSQEFEADELEEVKTRFFREAETAGRLNHPNIVQIYDVGEEHDLAYIAMEFLEGHDLTAYVKQDNLLPLPLVMGIIYKAAMALDYAHKLNVVHRDIKPANIMYDPKAKQVKLTDFGIARITDSSKTKTGMVLGTPSYMSPEQLSGKKVDGRSDLFSLGVTLYQLVSGKLPFSGDSMATLMYKIANEPHPDLNAVKPELAKTKPCLASIINKALDKNIDQRYQAGAEMARDLQQCAKQGTA